MSSSTRQPTGRICEYAGERDLIVVSKDSDFRQLAFLYGPPPKVVWLRVGNQSTAQIATVLLDHMQQIETFVADDEEAMLVIPDTTDRYAPGHHRPPEATKPEKPP